MDGSGSDSDADPGCAGYNPRNPDWYGFVLTSSPDTNAGVAAKTVTWTVQNATSDGIPGVLRRDVASSRCWNPRPAGAAAQPGTLPDGSPGFVGLLARCDVGNVEVAVPCVPMTRSPSRRTPIAKPGWT